MALEQQPQRRSACWPSVGRPGALHFKSLPDPWRLLVVPVEVRAPDWILVVLQCRNQEPLELPMSSPSLIKSRSRPTESAAIPSNISVGGLGSFSLRNIRNSTSLRLCDLHPKALAYPASPGSPQAFPLWPAPHACTRQPRDPKRQTLPRPLCTSDQSFELLRLSIRRLPVFAIPAPVFRS